MNSSSNVNLYAKKKKIAFSHPSHSEKKMLHRQDGVKKGRRRVKYLRTQREPRTFPGQREF
jgi:hypothetical protein